MAGSWNSRWLTGFVLGVLMIGCPTGGTDDDVWDDDDTTGDDDSGDDDSAGDDDTVDDDTGDDDTAPANCSGGAGAVTGGQFIVVQGVSAWLYVPAEPVSCSSFLMFGHGGGSPGGALDGVWDDKFHTELPARSELRGFPFLVPGLEEGANIQHEWGTDATGYLDAMIDEVGTLTDIDLNDVLFAGTSSGGHMAAWYGLYAPQRLSHVAVLSAGLGGVGFYYPVPDPDPKLPFYVGHDPEDTIVPYLYSEALANELENHDHDYVFEDFEASGDNHHGWTPEVTDRVLEWWL